MIYETKCSLNCPKKHVEKPKLFFSKRRPIPVHVNFAPEVRQGSPVPHACISAKQVT